MSRQTAVPTGAYGGNPRSGMYNQGSPVSGLGASTHIGYRPQNSNMAGAISDIAGAHQQQYDAASAANEERYQEIHGGYSDLHDRTMESLGERSEQGLADIGTAYSGERARVGQSMASRGLYGTSVLDATNLGLTSEQTAAENRFQDEQLREQRVTDIGLTQGRLGFMERREDTYPDSGVLMNLMQMLGQAGPMGLSPEIMQLFQSIIGPGTLGE